ncbi:MAG TPA: AAA family ATPase [Candidatus Paceibacterota bacterium]
MKHECNIPALEMDQLPEDVQPQIKEACKAWSDIYFTVSLNPRLMLFYGPAGTFKSSTSSMYEMRNRHLERFPITPETCWAELRGGFMPDGKDGARWLDGFCTRAWRMSNTDRGCRAVIDEIDQAGGDTIAGLHMFTDGKRIAKMTLPNGETLTPGDKFQCFATTNALPQNLPEALNDRFAIKREVLFPDPRFLFGLDQKLRVAAAYSLYNKSASDANLRGLTTRSWIQVNEFMADGVDLKSAVQAVVGYKLANAAAKAIEAAALKKAVQVSLDYHP